MDSRTLVSPTRPPRVVGVREREVGRHRGRNRLRTLEILRRVRQGLEDREGELNLAINLIG